MGLAGAGANVVIADLNEENAKRQAQAIRDLGRKALACQADVTRKADIQRVLEATLANFGGVEILLNAAGINSGTPFLKSRKPNGSVSSTWICAASSWLARCSARPWLTRAKAGPSSTFLRRLPTLRYPRCSPIGGEGGVNQITKFLAREFAPSRVRVNAIQPGFFPRSKTASCSPKSAWHPS